MLRHGHRRLVLRHDHRRLGDRRQGVAVIWDVRDNHGRVDPYMVVLVEERVAKDRRSALGRRAVHLAAERDESLVAAALDGRRRDDLGGLLAGAWLARRAVELREAFPLQLAVIADEVGGQWDAEGAGLVHRPHGRALVLTVAVPALHGHLKTWDR